MNSGLISDISQYNVQYGKVAVWWLGQHGFIFKTSKSKTIFVDVYFSPHVERQIQPFLNPHFVNNANLILGSHDHEDHIDRYAWPILAKNSPEATFIVPEAIRKSLIDDLKIPESKFLGLDDGLTVEKEGVRITGIAAAHELLEQNDDGQYLHLGFVIEIDGRVIYHAGDTCNYEGLQTKLSRWTLDAALLPINGRDAKRLSRGCVGCMTYQEAADIAGSLQPKLTIPTHYDMFANNSENPQLFTGYMQVKYPNLKTYICEHGKSILLD